MAAPAGKPVRPRHQQPLLHLLVGLVLGILAAMAAVLAGWPWFAVPLGWTLGAGLFTIWTWLTIQGMDGQATKTHAEAEDPGHRPATAILIAAALLSLAGVGVLLQAGTRHDIAGYVDGLGGFASVAASWFVVHMVYVLRYAREYYAGPDGGIDFPGDQNLPDYRDFAYFSYCLGMTYQVSDTTVKTRELRRMVLNHTLLSYLLGAVVVASTINLVVQLAS